MSSSSPLLGDLQSEREQSKDYNSSVDLTCTPSAVLPAWYSLPGTCSPVPATDTPRTSCTRPPPRRLLCTQKNILSGLSWLYKLYREEAALKLPASLQFLLLFSLSTIQIRFWLVGLFGSHSSSAWRGTETDDLQMIWGLLKVGVLVLFDDSRRLSISWTLPICVQLYVFCLPEIDSDNLIIYIFWSTLLHQSQNLLCPGQDQLIITYNL